MYFCWICILWVEHRTRDDWIATDFTGWLAPNEFYPGWGSSSYLEPVRLCILECCKCCCSHCVWCAVILAWCTLHRISDDGSWVGEQGCCISIRIFDIMVFCESSAGVVDATKAAIANAMCETYIVTTKQVHAFVETRSGPLLPIGSLTVKKYSVYCFSPKPILIEFNSFIANLDVPVLHVLLCPVPTHLKLPLNDVS